MSGPEVVIVVLGLMAGYWIVSSLLGRSKRPPGTVDGSTGAEPAIDAGVESYASSLPWHNVLGVLAEASVEDIRRAYKVLRSQYHPDKVAALGPELQEVAERKSKEISTAYRQAMRERGVNEQLW